MAYDLLLPCPCCKEIQSADPGHHLCRLCEPNPQARRVDDRRDAEMREHEGNKFLDYAMEYGWDV